ncbi:MAG: M23 family metallopeptidase [Deltaproteobacteria bacterium]|nr:MAG: M23 family metallopeptidase [Deltaproteobacteria bacterium]
MKPHKALFVLVMIAGIGMFLLPRATDNSKASEPQGTDQFGEASSLQAMEGWFALKFDPRIHSKTKLPSELRANKINPFVKRPYMQLQSFQSSIDNNLRPGVEYDTVGEPVRAVASGIVHFVGQIPASAGRHGGLYVRVAHDFFDGLKKKFYPRVTLYRNQAYRSSYYHLSKVVVEHWQAVKRAQIIGYGSRYDADKREKVKIVLEERGNWVNPDSFGQNHGFMNYWNEGNNFDRNLQEMNFRLDKQIEIVKRLYTSYARRDCDALYNKLHTVIDTEKYKNYPVKWSTIDRFKYLTYLYSRDSNLFPGLSSAEFDILTKEFYDNQPIILTLPFR